MKSEKVWVVLRHGVEEAVLCEKTADLAKVQMAGGVTKTMHSRDVCEEHGNALARHMWLYGKTGVHNVSEDRF